MALIRRVSSAILCMVIFVGLSPALAGGLAAPQGEPLLTINGAISQKNEGEAAAFDRAMLEEMPAVTIRTHTIWTEGEQTFEGVSLKALMDAVGATGSEIRAVALNDYAVDIPMDDARDGAAIVAYKQNGEPMPIRKKGPLWVIYPYDSDPKFRAEVIYSRSIWQLHKLEVSK